MPFTRPRCPKTRAGEPFSSPVPTTSLDFVARAQADLFSQPGPHEEFQVHASEQNVRRRGPPNERGTPKREVATATEWRLTWAKLRCKKNRAYAGPGIKGRSTPKPREKQQRRRSFPAVAARCIAACGSKQLNAGYRSCKPFFRSAIEAGTKPTVSGEREIDTMGGICGRESRPTARA